MWGCDAGCIPALPCEKVLVMLLIVPKPTLFLSKIFLDEKCCLAFFGL